MQYDVETPAAYMASLEKDWRRDTLEELRTLIRSKAPELEEGINYKMLSFRDVRGIVFHLNAQKNYVSLYVGTIDKIDPERALLQGLGLGKSCVRFGKSVAVAETRIGEFIERALELWKQGADIGC